MIIKDWTLKKTVLSVMYIVALIVTVICIYANKSYDQFGQSIPFSIQEYSDYSLGVYIVLSALIYPVLFGWLSNRYILLWKFGHKILYNLVMLLMLASMNIIGIKLFLPLFIFIIMFLLFESYQNKKAQINMCMIGSIIGILSVLNAVYSYMLIIVLIIAIIIRALSFKNILALLWSFSTIILISVPIYYFSGYNINDIFNNQLDSLIAFKTPLNDIQRLIAPIFLILLMIIFRAMNLMRYSSHNIKVRDIHLSLYAFAYISLIMNLFLEDTSSYLAISIYPVSLIIAHNLEVFKGKKLMTAAIFIILSALIISYIPFISF